MDLRETKIHVFTEKCDHPQESFFSIIFLDRSAKNEYNFM